MLEVNCTNPDIIWNVLQKQSLDIIQRHTAVWRQAAVMWWF